MIKLLRPAAALAPIVGGWFVNLTLRCYTFPPPGGFSPGVFVPRSHDTAIAFLDAGSTFCTYCAAGWILAPPRRVGGLAAWLVLTVVLLMLGCEVAIKAVSMAASLNYDYWVYVAQSLPVPLSVPLLPSECYLCLPIVGLVAGYCTSSVIGHRVRPVVIGGE